MIDIIITVAKIAIALLVLWISKWYFFPHYLPSVPIRKRNHWFFGFTNTIPSTKGKFDAHLLCFNEAERLGRIFQYYNIGRLRMFVSDKYIAKFVMENIHGKGFYHMGNPKINHPSIFSIDTGPEWKKRRSAFRQSFSMIALKQFQERLRLLSKKLCDALSESAEKKSIVEIDYLFGEMTVDVICSLAFQYDLQAMEHSTLSQEVHDAIRVYFLTGWFALIPYIEYLVYLPIPAFVQYRKAQDKIAEFCLILFHHIKKMHAEGTLKKESVGYALLEFSKLDGITEKDIVAEILVMFIAGHETTSHTLSFFVYALATHPEVQSKCHSAIDEATTATTAEGSSSTMSLLPAYVEAVLKESMRLYSVTARGAMRQVQNKEGVTIPVSVLNRSYTEGSGLQKYTHDITLPYQSWVQVYTYNIHCSKLSWGAKADEFIPERFLANGNYTGEATNTNTTTATTTGSNPLSSPAIYGGGGVESDDLLFLPFAYGLRNCIGMNLALIELRTVLFDILTQFSFTLADESLKDEKVAFETLFTSRPHKQLPVYVSHRKVSK